MLCEQPVLQTEITFKEKVIVNTHWKCLVNFESSFYNLWELINSVCMINLFINLRSRNSHFQRNL